MFKKIFQSIIGMIMKPVKLLVGLLWQVVKLVLQLLGIILGIPLGICGLALLIVFPPVFSLFFIFGKAPNDSEAYDGWKQGQALLAAWCSIWFIACVIVLLVRSC